MRSLLLLGLTALLHLGAAELDLGFKHFQNIFGKNRVATHFDNVEHFNSEIESHFRAAKNTDEATKYITCTTYKTGSEAKASLVATYGDVNVHTLYTSARSNAACFLVSGKQPASSVLRGKDYNLRFWMPMPKSMKINHVVMYMLGLMDADHAAHDDIHAMYKSARTRDLSEFRLSVAYGMGAIDKGVKKEDVAASVAAFAAQMSLPAHVHLRHLASESTRSYKGSRIWHTSAEALASHPETEDVCRFSQLKIEQLPFGITIDNLQQIQSTATPEACFASLLSMIAAHPHVLDITLKMRPRTFNNFGRPICQAATTTTTSTPYSDAGLTGENQIVGVGDTGVDELHCFFANADNSKVARSTYKSPTYDMSKRKVIQYINYMDGSDYSGGHGTHVCGTIAGVSLSGTNEAYNGHASGAKIAFFDMGKGSGGSLYYPQPISNFFDPAYDAGARVHSNSWGGALNIYDSDTIVMDAYHVVNDDFLAIFAAGNDGTDGYYSIGDPAVSKNCLAVGATESTHGSSFSEDIDNMAYFSSMGPTFDGRIKPDVVAPGYSIYSAYAGTTCDTLSMAGTSMATPGVAGNALMVRQYFIDGDFWESECNGTYSMCGAFSPLGATVKAALIHSGTPMASYHTQAGLSKEPEAPLNSPPDMYQGFGRVLLSNVLPVTGITDSAFDLFVDEVSLETAEEWQYEVTVTDTSIPLKATIAWMDPENSIITMKMLLHDVDLKIVRNSDGETYWGNNVIQDEVNNVEQVTINTPVAGVYTVHVTGKLIVENPTQDVSVIITSGGSVTDTTNVASVSDDDLNACAAGEILVSFTMLDNNGDGWGSGNTYEIRLASDNSLVHSSSLTSDIPNDFYVVDKVCLDEDEDYTVELITSGSNSDQMGLDVEACGVYLSGAYVTSGALSLSSGTCNACAGADITVALIGSFYGIPYGWKSGSHYEVRGLGKVLTKGTLTTGVAAFHYLCLPEDGTYTVSVSGVPNNDDFLNDDYLQPYVGVEEYGYFVSGCVATNNPNGNSLDYSTIVTVSGSSCTMKMEDNAGAILGVSAWSWLAVLASAVGVFLMN